MDYDLKKLHSVETELLKEFLKICREAKLRYYLVGGSALGAVKYRGFVPWDDDIDVAMPREDYETFLGMAQERLPRHIFLQNYRTDPEFPMLFSKLRNSNTAFIEPGFRKMNMNHGIYIDIFPLDGYPEGKAGRLWLNIKLIYYKTVLAFARNKVRNLRSVRGLTEQIGYNLFGRRIAAAKIFARFERCVRKYETRNSTFWYNYGNKLHAKEKVPAVWYGKGADAVFEGMEVVIPEDYDSFLRYRFGDYHADLPEEKRVPSHIPEKVDTEQSYMKWLSCGIPVKK